MTVPIPVHAASSTCCATAACGRPSFVAPKRRVIQTWFSGSPSEGHEPGNHSFHHPDFGILPSRRRPAGDCRHAARASAVALSASTPPLFRPPYGTLSRVDTRRLAEGHTVVLWNVDFRTSRPRVTRTSGSRWRAGHRLRATSSCHPAIALAALAALPDVLAAAQRSALALVPVSKNLRELIRCNSSITIARPAARRRRSHRQRRRARSGRRGVT